MLVNGVEIPQAAIDEAHTRMRQGSFEAKHIEFAMRRAGVESAVNAMRAADRLIQQARRAGKIYFANRRWHWAEER